MWEFLSSASKRVLDWLKSKKLAGLSPPNKVLGITAVFLWVTLTGVTLYQGYQERQEARANKAAYKRLTPEEKARIRENELIVARETARLYEERKVAMSRLYQEQKMGEERRELDAKTGAELTVTTMIPSANPRAEIEGTTLVIYLKTTEFRSLPFPDQPKLAEALAEFWCKKERGGGVFSSVKIRDIGTGQELDSKFCMMR